MPKLKKAAIIFVPKAFKFSRTVSGQIPTGWDAGRYGIPEDIIAQTDRATLWALVCTAEALNASGIIHMGCINTCTLQTFGTCLGSGMGGVTSMAKIFKDRRDEKDVQNDDLQETYVIAVLSISTNMKACSFINTTAGWINLLLLSSSGPVKIPAGAWCALLSYLVENLFHLLLSARLLSNHWRLLPTPFYLEKRKL